MLKKRFLTQVLLLALAFSFTSCINIVEKIIFKKDGGGTYSITIDLSEMVNMLKMMGSEELDDTSSMMDSLSTGFETFKTKFEALEGITNARYEVDKESFKVTTLYDFEDVSALNRALSEYYRVDEKPAKQFDFFSLDKKKLIRIDESPFATAIREQLKAQDMDFDPAMFFGEMYYESILVFEQKVKGISDSDYREIDDHSIGLKYYPFKASDENKKLAVEVKLK